MNSDKDPNADAFDHLGERERETPPAPAPRPILTARAVRIGPPADSRHGEIFAPGSITPARIPVTRAFDSSTVIGWADVDADGMATLSLEPGTMESSKIRHVGLGFRVIDSTFEEGIRTITKLDPLVLGIEFAPTLPVVGGIGEQWAEYLPAVGLERAPAVQVEELRRAFYAGAQGMYFAIMNATDSGDDDAIESRLDALAREMADYLRLFTKREIKP